MVGRWAKPVILLVGALALLAAAVTTDPNSPTCGSVPLAPGQVCQVQQHGALRQRGYAELVHDATQARLVLLLAAGVLLLAGALIVALSRRPTPAPALAPSAPAVPIVNAPVPRYPDPMPVRRAPPRTRPPRPEPDTSPAPPIRFQRPSFVKPTSPPDEPS